ncbi:hypothetical protein SERLA73DRAFT_126614 [Serpula lacrymans var. lacrymans S7.3]|uniref:C2H2-type domain-containing protein n=2 Tax=Serpula lacrymans var. lacrymans TaxID=341189 RepID=F8QDU7_SERL3|nr:uncharacterized protein SERLADRAFT_374846 [Serpula lacrymans var. lacrymans S7.9]EGN93768.1 hypothetical protein SERLA73DRAFT_126614 [Serpula lacrymans var. lacrymans S7.3]EGO19139.1 hypothetical protein SERLADRAFT_374846 [Serpula lacrymans var. lacrymans S7.9]
MMAFCDYCDRYFSNAHALSQHLRYSDNHNFPCWSCGVEFSTRTGLKEHYVQSRNHAYCQYCDEHFEDREDLIDHNHDNHSYCPSCNKVFKNDFGLHEHNRQVHHYCVSCKRLFVSASNLQAHMNSSTHRPRDVVCPFRGCAQAFVSKSALVLHLESGKCQSGVDRRTVDRYVPAWNGAFFECYLCHTEFRSLDALNQHLASPFHREKVYRCPLTSCRVQFVTLSALCQHVESEKCGVARFKSVQNTMDNMFSKMGRLTMN